MTEQSGTEVSIAPEIAEPLAGTILDLEETLQGTQLILMPQGDAEEQ